MDCLAFNLILDDILFPDGTSALGVLGGGGPQTAYGMRLWGASVGLYGGVGPDLPPEALAQLEGWGVDLAGLRRSSLPTLRARQTLDRRGGRMQTWLVPGEVVAAHRAHQVDLLPPAYRQARAFHLGVHPLEPELAFIHALRGLGLLAGIETFRPAEHTPAPRALHELLTAADLFSPNLTEAASLVGPGAPEELIRRLLALGATRVALRMGAAGSLIGEQDSGRAVFIPPVPVQVTDPIGAGNAYCGGLLAGFLQTGSLARAACMAAVSASFLVEQVGCPQILDEKTRAEAERRLRALN